MCAVGDDWVVGREPQPQVQPQQLTTTLGGPARGHDLECMIDRLMDY